MHAFDRQTDGQTDRQTDRNLIVRPRLHSMQRGNKTRDGKGKEGLHFIFDKSKNSQRSVYARHCLGVGTVRVVLK